jgi:DNA-binding response OmpR family regulator
MKNVARILVVDSDPWHLRMLAAELAGERYEVITAADGVEALAKALAQTPDLILSEIDLPVLDAWSLIGRIRQHERLACVPFIFLTLSSSKEDRIAAFRLGADDFIQRPIGSEELELRIGNALRRRWRVESSVRLGERRQHENTGLHGSVGELSLASLLEILELERKSGRLVVCRQAPEERALLFFSDGHIVRARISGRMTPRDAEVVYEVVNWQTAEFKFSAMPIDFEDAVHASTMHLVMEGARRADEAAVEAEVGAKAAELDAL